MKHLSGFAMTGLFVGVGLVFSAPLASALSVTDKITTGEKSPSPGAAVTTGNTPKRSSTSWLTNLNDGYAEARRLNRPILVRAGAAWCGWCRRLSDDLENLSVQEALSSYVRVYLDIDDSPRDAQSLGIGAIPALRVLNSAGRLIASHEGYMASADLAQWLSRQLPIAAAVTPSGLTKDGPLDAKTLQELIDQLRGREALLKEAAIQRLAAEPTLAVPAVVQLFAEGTLSERLSALELLDGWRAPIQDLDPWRPETITAGRLEALQAWARRMNDLPASMPAQLSGDVLENARRELVRLMQTDRDAEAEIARERLARLGLALLPLVAGELKQAATDRDRERLTALRYRLAAPRRLALEWPGGFDRLASTDAPTRQRAAEELASRAQADASTLLRELFSNPDPLVREISLRTLRKVGGEEANEALMGLLGDPEPNVRAAVLKQLAEQPSRKLVPKLAEYAAAEQDADLLVHAIRALRAAGGKDALDALSRMTGHDAWQVRAEAAEAIGEVVIESGDLPQPSRADAYVALLALLKDPDGFVTSRAMTSLDYADASLVMEPLVQATLDHPEMAGSLVDMLADRGRDAEQTGRHLRKLLSANHASIRAAAIEQLCKLFPKKSERELLTAFGDPEEEVRFAAAKGLMLVLAACRPSETPFRSYEYQTEEIAGTRSSLIARLLGLSSRRVVVRVTSSSAASTPLQSQPAADADWLANFRSGIGRPEWMDQAVAPLEGLLSSSHWEHRLVACICLIALGREETALPVLREVVRSQGAAVSQAAQALGWLPLGERVSLFHELLGLATGNQLMADVINGLAILSDPQAAGPLWELLGQNDFAGGWADTVQTSLRRLYLGPEHEWSDVSDERRQRLVTDTTPMTEKGPEVRQLVALSLLLTGSKADAVAAARKLYEAPESNSALRADALQIMLLGQSEEQAVQSASTALASRDDNIRGTALLYLARGKTELNRLRGTLSLHIFSEAEVTFQEFAASAGQAISPQAPQGLTVENVRPLLQSGDPATRAHAGYLLALLKQPEGLQPLVKYWRENARQDSMWRRQVYRAIAALNDDEHTPILEEIYKDLAGETSAMRRFYWTIRSMDGEKVFALRKKIRNEVGMDQLR
ncbi:MAG: HEAT repeat domain-containing protein [Phycisphaerae bacterium]